MIKRAVDTQWNISKMEGDRSWELRDLKAMGSR